MTKCIILLSGGQDSTTCLFYALKNFKEVIAVGFDYGQRHKIELEQAKKIADLVGVPYHIFDLKGLLGGSSLTEPTLYGQEHHPIDPSLPSSFTAGRNMLFLTIAASWGYNQGISDIVTGVCQTDYSGYPDCRAIFCRAMENALFHAMGKSFNIHTPLMHLTKAETWELAYKLRGEYVIDGKPQYLNPLEIVKQYTMTDYHGSTKMNDFGMGEENNPATILRANGYREAVKRRLIPDDSGLVENN